MTSETHSENSYQDHTALAPIPRASDIDDVLSGASFTARDVALCSSDEARSFLSSEDALALDVLPLSLTRSSGRPVLHVATSSDAPVLLSKLKFLCGAPISVTIVSSDILREAIPYAYFGSDRRLHQLIQRVSTASAEPERRRGIIPDVPEARGDAARFITGLLEFAAVRGASDLHLAPGEDGVTVKMRVNGELLILEQPPYAKVFHEQVVTRLKVLASLDISTRRVPLDGSFIFKVGSLSRSARVSTLPSIHGESVVIRLLSSVAVPDLARLGIEPTGTLLLRAALARSEGIVLLTGPTGSGKTTTMYAAVGELARRGRNVVTVEDPVEVPLDGVVQVQVCLEQGLDYPRAIRSVLRHDPDALLIGEMRDGISAAIALDAASTGHLTLSSLHVGSSLQAISRLEVLGVERARSVPPVILVINQRLLSKLCMACKKPEERPGAAELSQPLYEPSGCDHCSGSGYQGRVLITEILDLQSQAAKDAFYRTSTTTELLEQLPNGAFIPWTEALQYHLRQGDICMEQVEQFIAAEMR
jgi:type II secretory ATPase GspE/PulE/Tfp pilus assembly ATPase PilB-like protein